MHISIDTSPLASGHKLRGIGSYTRSLIDALQTYEKGHRYSFFDNGVVPKGVDIVHYPYFDPFFLTLPLKKVKPTVVTVHDLIPLVYPDKFPSGVRGKMKWWIQKWSLRMSSGIMTDSYASKEDIQKILGVSEKKISVIYLAPPAVFRPQTNTAMRKKVQKTYGLPEKYILYVGDVNWNKNIPSLIRAFADVKSHDDMPGLKLVLVGKAFTNSTLRENQQIHYLIKEHLLERDIIRTGPVDTDDLRALYGLASAYVQPSFAEGFGFPVLEAMACGCPVVSSGASSLKEIVGPGIMTDTAAESIALGIKKALSVDRAVQVRLQHEWVKRFSWQRTAAQTVKVYEHVLGKI